MRKLALIFFLVSTTFLLKGQNDGEINMGRVSYITSQNIYVKFASTDGMAKGDTLFQRKNGALIPALLVQNLSSISCVCTPLSIMEIHVGDSFIRQEKEEIDSNITEVNDQTLIVAGGIATIPTKDLDTVSKKQRTKKQSIHGRLSLASYSNFSNTPGGNNQRMRYTFSMTANHIGNSKFSTETYVSFVHRNNHWDEIQENIFNGLKIYNLAVKYEPTNNLQIWLGRKINPNISNLGAIDGLQLENKFKSISVGAFVGSRPDYRDYSFNLNLLQYGAYVGHHYGSKHGNMQTTVAFAEQKNNGKTDRRFAYLQHYNDIVKNLYFFGSAELELYQIINGEQQSNVKLSNLYAMLRYRIIKPLSISISYSERQNLIYYETYKDYVEQLLDEDKIQGFRAQISYRPHRNISLGVKAGYRARKQDPRPSQNLYGYVNIGRIPGINAAANISATFLETAYLKGNIYSLGLSKDLVAGKLYGGFNFRYVDYRFVYYESTLKQYVGDVNLSWKIIKKLSLSVAYEGVFESTNTYNRIYVNLTKRF